MRGKILDQYKYVKTAGTAFDRTGFDMGTAESTPMREVRNEQECI